MTKNNPRFIENLDENFTGIKDNTRNVKSQWITLKDTLMQIWKSTNIFVFAWKWYVEDLSLKRLSRFEIYATEMCEKFVLIWTQTCTKILKSALVYLQHIWPSWGSWLKIWTKMLHKLGIIQWTEISRSRSQADVEINAILCTSHPLSAGGVELSLHSDFQKRGGWGGGRSGKRKIT